MHQGTSEIIKGAQRRVACKVGFEGVWGVVFRDHHCFPSLPWAAEWELLRFCLGFAYSSEHLWGAPSEWERQETDPSVLPEPADGEHRSDKQTGDSTAVCRGAGREDRAPGGVSCRWHPPTHTGL